MDQPANVVSFALEAECNDKKPQTQGANKRLAIPQELDSLTGPAAAMCLLLELNDVGAPLLHMLARRLASAVQWLLTTLIGRSLGLIVRGVRQSFTWGQGPKDPSTPPAKEPASTQYAPRFA